MPATPYESAKKSLEALGLVDQLRLAAEIVSRVSGELSQQPRSLLELDGLGQELWQSVDVEDYLRRERSSWNG
jgi:hypothetical protein